MVLRIARRKKKQKNMIRPTCRILNKGLKFFLYGILYCKKIFFYTHTNMCVYYYQLWFSKEYFSRNNLARKRIKRERILRFLFSVINIRGQKCCRKKMSYPMFFVWFKFESRVLERKWDLESQLDVAFWRRRENIAKREASETIFSGFIVGT